MRNDLSLDLFACVDCRAPLAAADHCAACGRDYPATADGRTPVLFPSVPRRYEVDLSPDFWNPDTIPTDDVFRVPERNGLRGSGVYHLDKAHADLFETLPRGATVLETGCGGAQLRPWAVGRGLNYVGTDITTDRVRHWLQDYGGADVLCDAHSLPFRDACVDAVYATSVYEHLAFPHLAAAEAARVLKPGGYSLGSVAFLEPWHDHSYFHISPNGVWQMLTAAGLRPLRIWPELEWPAYRALLRMGNRTTRRLTSLGRLMHGLYLMPSYWKFRRECGRWPDGQDLYRVRAKVTGAVSWIAVKDGEGPE